MKTGDSCRFETSARFIIQQLLASKPETRHIKFCQAFIYPLQRWAKQNEAKTITGRLPICVSTQYDTVQFSASYRNTIVTYRVFYSRWKSISVPKSQHTTLKYTQPFSKHTSGVYTQRCPTRDSFYMTSSGNLPTRTHILAVSKSPHTGARPASTFFVHKLSFLQSESFQTHVLLSHFPNSNSSLPTKRSP
jgi:hypothetical protein